MTFVLSDKELILIAQLLILHITVTNNNYGNLFVLNFFMR